MGKETGLLPLAVYGRSASWPFYGSKHVHSGVVPTACFELLTDSTGWRIAPRTES